MLTVILSFTFQTTESLLDRNIKITLLDNEVIIENDWLGSIPIFYNTKAKIISHSMMIVFSIT